MGDGLTGEDLGELRRELFVAALEVARGEHDAVSDWEGFCASAWREAGLAFGFLEREQVGEVGRVSPWLGGYQERDESEPRSAT